MKNFSVQNFEENIGEDIKIDLGETNYGLFFGIMDKNSNPLLEAYNYLEVSATFNHNSVNKPLSYTSIQLDRCKEEDIHFLPIQIQRNILLRYKVEDFLCLKGKGLVIGGNFFIEGTGHIVINLQIKNEFRNEEGLQQILQFFEENDVNFAFHERSFYFSPDDITEPIKFYMESTFLPVDYFLEQEVDFIYKQHVAFV